MATASLAAVGWVGVSATAAMAAPFDQNTPAFWISQGSGGGATAAYEGVQAGGAVTFEQVGPSAPEFSYNAMGFRSADGYLWAVSDSRTDPVLTRIGNTGETMQFGSDLPALVNTGYNVGAFGQGEFADRLLITDSDNMETMYIVNVDTGTVESQAITHSDTVGDLVPDASDWTAHAGYLWGGQQDGEYIVRVDPASGILDMFEVDGLTTAGALGGAWTYGNDNLGFSSNTTGDITQVQVDDPSSATPVFTVVSVVPGPPSGGNDGANAVGAPTDLGVVKTAPATVDSAGTIDWDIAVTNYSATKSSGFTLTDVMPEGVTDVQATGPSAALCTVTGLSAWCIGDPLAAGATVSYSFSGTAPSTEATLVNTVSVNANEGDPVPSNDSSSSTTTVTVVVPAELPATGTEGLGLMAGSAGLLLLAGLSTLVILRRRQTSGA